MGKQGEAPRLTAHTGSVASPGPGKGQAGSPLHPPTLLRRLPRERAGCRLCSGWLGVLAGPCLRDSLPRGGAAAHRRVEGRGREGGTHYREGEPSNHQGASTGPHAPGGSGSPDPLSWGDGRVSRGRSSCGFKFVSHFWTTLPEACRGLRFFFGKHCNYPVNGTIIFVRVLKVFICSM